MVLLTYEYDEGSVRMELIHWTLAMGQLQGPKNSGLLEQNAGRAQVRQSLNSRLSLRKIQPKISGQVGTLIE
jgi:hypothetical protein